MKTLLFFLVIGFSLCTAGKAQTSLVSTREKFRHHEISVSYGFLPITDANSIAEEFIAPTASFGGNRRRALQRNIGRIGGG